MNPRLARILQCLASGVLLCWPLSSCSAQSTAIRVEVAPTGGGWQLLRDGRPYFVHGVGGSGPLSVLRACGGNSVRTWGSDNLQPLLDEAQGLGLTVAVGIWLGQPRQGFDYHDPQQVAGQRERVREAVLRYKDHPAVLLWGLGNEVEGSGEDSAIWTELNELAKLTKGLDAAHPTMTAIAELGGAKVENLHRLCPALDIVGINSYAGGPSVAKRYADAGGAKPFLVTEFGPPGPWEWAKTPWGASLEPTSTEKADWYRRTYEGSVADQPLCLGSYAFLWGAKQEQTATWFGMLLPDGTRLPQVDAMQELWSGSPPANGCPAIESLKLQGPAEADPGATTRVELRVVDAENDPLTVRWVLQAEQTRFGAGGDTEAAPPVFPEAVTEGDAQHAVVRLPAAPGGCRLFAYVTDGQGGGATANVPLLIKGKPAPPGPRRAALPLVLYDEAGTPRPYAPSGWMGNTGAIRMDEASRDDPHTGQVCLRCEYTAADNWAGVVWQDPPNDWGDQPGGLDLSGAKRLSFWARGEKGGEKVTFGFGILGQDKPHPDSAGAKREDVTLTAEWRQYSIDLAQKDLTRIKTGFMWVVAGQGAPVTFHLDDVRYE